MEKEITDIEYITKLVEKIYEKNIQLQHKESIFNDTLFYCILVSVFGIGLLLLANRFIPENFLNYSNVQPLFSSCILLFTLILLLLVKYFMKPAKKTKKNA